jgi:hypothetical protein
MEAEMANHETDNPAAVESAATPMLREVVGVFHEESALEAATDELQECGFDRAEISLLASDRAVAEKLGHAYQKVAELEDDRLTARVAYVSKEDYGAAEGGLISGLIYVGALAGAGAVVASGGALAGALIAAALSGGTGGAVGFGLARWLERRRAGRLHEQLEKGGLLIWVHVGSVEREKRAIDILHKHVAEDVHAHELGADSDAAALAPYPPLLRLVESMTPHQKAAGVRH